MNDSYIDYVFAWIKVNVLRRRTFGLRRSPKWRVVREAHLRKNKRCAVCGSQKKPEVHHIIPVHVDPSQELKRTNLITLCRRDHFVFGHLCNWQKYNETVTNDAKYWHGRIRNGF